MTYFKTKNAAVTSEAKTVSIGERPVFFLAYLAFYFFPWLFQTPTINDVLAAVVAIILFVPIYFHGYQQTGTNGLPHIVAISLIGFAVSPFFGSHGVFHIYAMVQTGFVRPERKAWITASALSIVYCAFALLTQQSWWDIIFPVFMGLMITVATISAAGRMEQAEQLELARELEPVSYTHLTLPTILLV